MDIYDKVELTHLEYVDDTILFLPKDDTTHLNYRRMLDCFSTMTGLHINFSKSALVGCNWSSEWIDEMSQVFGIFNSSTTHQVLGTAY